MPKKKRPTEVGDVQAGRDVILGDQTIYGPSDQQLHELFLQVIQESRSEPQSFDGLSPYVGLTAFQEKDAALFFGRERSIRELLGRVEANRAVFIAGASGSGKSSLIRAGLIPALKQGKIQGSEHWIYATLTPGRDPLNSLAEALSRLKSAQTGDYFLERAGSDRNALHKAIVSALSDDRKQRALLFIDQFEEVFTQAMSKEERQLFIHLLIQAINHEDGRLLGLFTIRSDFIGNCAAYPALNQLLNQQFYQVSSLEPADLLLAITRPASQVGLPIEEALVTQIIQDTQNQPGVLPLVQFALKDLFDYRQAQGGRIELTRADYLFRGGIHKALELHADHVFNQLNDDEQKLAEKIFSRLIRVGSETSVTGRTIFLDELVSQEVKAGELRSVVDKLANEEARLLITDEQDDKDTLSLSHEKLIEAWPWLKRLVNQNREVIALQEQIEEDAQQWIANHKDTSYLYRGAQLGTIREKASKVDLGKTAQEFLEASIAAEDQMQRELEQSQRETEKSRRRVLTGLISFSTIVLGLLILSLLQLRITIAQQIGSQARSWMTSGYYNQAALYAYQSNKLHQNSDAGLVLSSLSYKNFLSGKALLDSRHWVGDIAWSPDGQLASGSSDNAVVLWDLKTGKPAQTLKGHSDYVYRVAWSPEGRLASASADQTVILWDLKNDRPAKILRGHAGAVNDVAWSTNGSLASAAGDTIIIWDLETGKPAQVLKDRTASVTDIAWSGDGRLASGSGEGAVILWDLETGTPAQVLKGHTGPVNNVAWSYDGRLASASGDNTIILWDLETGKPAQTLKGHTAPVDNIAWSSDGQLASGSRDGSVIVWKVPDGEPAKKAYGHLGIVTGIAWSSDGKLASGSSDGTIILWDTQPGEPAQTLSVDNEHVTSVARSADGRLASGTGSGKVILWDLESGKPVEILQGHSGVVTSLAWSRDGRLASASRNNTGIILWDLATQKPAQTLQGHTDYVTSLAWSADGRLASGSADKTVILWDVASGHPKQILKGHSYSIPGIAWSPTGQLASVSFDLILWDLEISMPAQVIKGQAESLAWSEDGRLATGTWNHTVILWDLKAGKPARTFRGHTEYVDHVAWSSDGKLASGAQDKTVIIWDMQTGQPAAHLEVPAESMTWLGSGQLAIVARDGSIRINRSDLDPCGWILRNMTEEEWVASHGFLFLYQATCPGASMPTLSWWNTRSGRLMYLGLALPIVLVPISRSLFRHPVRKYRVLFIVLFMMVAGLFSLATSDLLVQALIYYG